MKRILLIALVLVTGAFCLFAADYYIRNFDVQITVGNNAVHHIVETIDVYFEGPHHGIVREIPVDYTDYNGTTARVTGVKCSDKFESDTENGYYVMKIGSASKYLEGDVRYVIEYDYDLGADTVKGYDELYLNVIGAEWECPIKNVTFDIFIPFIPNEEFANIDAFSDYLLENSYYTTGKYGSTTSTAEVYIIDGEGGLVIQGRVINLDAYEAVTIKTDLPEGWYTGAREPWDHRGTANMVHIVVTVLLVALAAFLWTAYGRDRTPIVVARFEPPKGFSPLMVGYLADSSVDDKDVISMLFYWADQGLLSITEKRKNKYEFTKLKDIEAYAVEKGKDIPDFEVKLFNGFFKNCNVGDVITFDKLQKNNFFETIVESKMKTKSYFSKDRALYDRKSKSYSALLKFLSLVPLLTGCLRLFWCENTPDEFFLLGPAALILAVMNLGMFSTLFTKWHLRKSNVFPLLVRFLPSVIVFALFTMMEMDILGRPGFLQNALAVFGSTAMAFLGTITEKRSEYGEKVLEETLGYREFIDKVEIDQLKMMIDQDPDFYYHVLSYAVVLGLENKWAKKFDGMIVAAPSWYSGYDAFDVYMMSRLASNMIRTIPIASMPKSSPGSKVGGGGFHSSGFSGGGFGGGGGHAW